ncbi:response regulator transcription factor [Ornithinibacillus sp. 4-3]|uniref:Response regulator transcription factor n=1 Tax=Ornithinibacillus sp. 4-3 TaxID=3231488 RepID=A0AB39HRR6_9BACI
MASPCILIVEDDSDLSNLIKTTLENEGCFNILIAHTFEEGLKQFKDHQPDLVILDVMLPDGSGYELCRSIRENSHIPIIFLSAKSEEVDKILGLSIGGDDYVTKPFLPRELAYRVKAQLRRVGIYSLEKKVQQQQQIGCFSINEDETEIFKNGKKLKLTAKEFGLLLCFLHNPNRILSKETIYSTVWEEEYLSGENTLMVHISRLREKIEVTPTAPKHLITVKGFGYRFFPHANEA